MTKKIYLAGPMSGIKDFNFPAFDAAATMLRGYGHIVFNPADADREKWGNDVVNIGKKATYAECMRIDLNWIIDHATAIALLPGWEKSKGAQAEYWLSRCLGILQYHLVQNGDGSYRVDQIVSFTRDGRFPHMQEDMPAA